MSKQQITDFTQKHRGSILAYSLIILSMMMLIVVSISTSSIIEKKAASGTEFSMQSLQTADSGVNLALKSIRANTSATIEDLKLTLGGSCDTGRIVGATGPASSNYDLTFYSTEAGAEGDRIANCGASVGTIKNIKSVGTYKGTARAVSVAVANAASLVVSAPVLVTINDVNTATASCASGEKILGGGGSCFKAGFGTTMMESVPVGDAWRVTCNVVGGNVGNVMKAYAICGK